MNLQPLFTTARVVTAIYRIASTAILLTYLVKRRRRYGNEVPRRRRAPY